MSFLSTTPTNRLKPTINVKYWRLYSSDLHCFRKPLNTDVCDAWIRWHFNKSNFIYVYCQLPIYFLFLDSLLNVKWIKTTGSHCFSLQLDHRPSVWTTGLELRSDNTEKLTDTSLVRLCIWSQFMIEKKNRKPSDWFFRFRFESNDLLCWRLKCIWASQWSRPGLCSVQQQHKHINNCYIKKMSRP